MGSKTIEQLDNIKFDGSGYGAEGLLFNTISALYSDAQKKVDDIIQSIHAYEEAKKDLTSVLPRPEQAIEQVRKSDTLQSDLKKYWKTQNQEKLAALMLDIVNINFFISGKNMCRPEEKDKDFCDSLRGNLLNAIANFQTADPSSLDEANKTITCFSEALKSVKEEYTEKMRNLKRARLCRYATGAFFASLTGLGLMEFWVKHKAEVFLRPRWMTGATSGLYACLAVSAAVLAFKCGPVSKDKRQKGGDKSSQTITHGWAEYR